MYRDKGFLASPRANAACPGVEEGLRHLAAAARPTSPPRRELPAETVWTTPTLPGNRAEAVRAAARRSRQRGRAAARRASPAHAHRGGAPGARAWNRIGCSGWRTRRRPRTSRPSKLIRQHSVTPLAVGEVFNSIWDCKHLIENQLIDYIRTTIVHGGGITHLRRLADFAALYQVRTGFHGATDLSPVIHGRGAALRHLGAQLRHPGVHASTARRPMRCSRTTICSATAGCTVGDSPGHGVTIDEEARGEVSVLAQTATCGASGRRLHVGLVTMRYTKSGSTQLAIATRGIVYNYVGMDVPKYSWGLDMTRHCDAVDFLVRPAACSPLESNPLPRTSGKPRSSASQEL